MTAHLVTIKPSGAAGMKQLLDWIKTDGKLRGVPDNDGKQSLQMTRLGMIAEVDDQDLEEVRQFGVVTIHATK